MRLVAIAFNVILLATAIGMYLIKGIPVGRRDYFLAFIIFAAPISSLLAFYFCCYTNGGETWIRSMFKKKGVERDSD
ncbi:MAG: hypothetical protein A3J24_00620 [Deltaproteobacteria bacterium RIFCSPLOWO2_02_FULL_53_8]|nr:MAG: hypothetical protein A3J24_00620 [Deltaproteobacteria bacterium RIFCSPLOWO2_02_FULL_53_8]